MQLTDYEKNSITKLDDAICEGRFSKDGMIQIIELIGSYLEPMTISDYAKTNKLSYNGVKKFRKTTKIFGVKFVIN